MVYYRGIKFLWCVARVFEFSSLRTVVLVLRVRTHYRHSHAQKRAKTRLSINAETVPRKLRESRVIYYLLSAFQVIASFFSNSCTLYWSRQVASTM
jgi:hypothetical protein